MCTLQDMANKWNPLCGRARTHTHQQLTVEFDGDAGRDGQSQVGVGCLAGERRVQVVTAERRQPQIIAHRVVECRHERVVDRATVAPPYQAR